MKENWNKITVGDLVYEMYLGPFGSSLKVDSYVDEADGFAIVYEQKHAIHANMDCVPHYINKAKFHELARFEGNNPTMKAKFEEAREVKQIMDAEVAE